MERNIDMKILVLGASGMLGNAVYRLLSENPGLEVRGTVRSAAATRNFQPELAGNLISGVDVEQSDALIGLLERERPAVVINCVGLVKQLADAENPLNAVPINTLLPHRLAKICSLLGARLVHVSTDCVFSGTKGGYTEEDQPDAVDLYGRSKQLGEVAYPNSVTLRTSIIGHELQGAHGLINWFLLQGAKCKGYTNAVFSGLPTVVLARVIRDHVLPNPSIRGIYHVAAQPISKFDLLTTVADVYQKKITIEPDSALVIDRSLNGSKFQQATGFVAGEWADLIKEMYDFERKTANV